MSEEQPDEINSLFDQLAGSASMSPLDAQSHEMHEMFLSLTRVGFSEKQALFIVSMALISLEFDEGPDEDDMIVFSSRENHPSENSDDLHSMTAEEPDDDLLEEEAESSEEESSE